MLLRAYVAATVGLCEAGRRLREQRGATAVEYALMLALIAAVIVAAVALLGQSTSGAFDRYNTDFANATS